MKNRLSDLNNHLFAQLERLGDEDLQGEALSEEIQRSKAVASISANIIDNARIVLEAEKMRHSLLPGNVSLPEMLESKK